MQTYLLARYNFSDFSTKNAYVIIMKITNFWRENLAIFHKVKKIEIDFPSNTFVSNSCWHRVLESKLFFINIFRRIFRMAKIKHSNSDFCTGLYYMQINNTYTNEPRNYKHTPCVNWPALYRVGDTVRKNF